MAKKSNKSIALCVQAADISDTDKVSDIPIIAQHIDDVEPVLLSLDCKVFRVDPIKLDLQEKEDVVDYIEQHKTVGYSTDQIKAEIQKVLDSEYKRCRYQDASFREYGFGATMVLIV